MSNVTPQAAEPPSPGPRDDAGPRNDAGPQDDSGPRYTEVVGPRTGGRAVRRCRLVAEPDTPVGQLEAHPFRSRILIAERAGTPAGYAIVAGRAFGDAYVGMTVDELAADDADSALALLGELARQAWELRIAEFRVYEPADGVLGRVARGLGCGVHLRYPPTGGMLARILDRPALVTALLPELRRRARAAGPVTDTALEVAVAELARGGLVPDDALLIRLLLGYLSAADAAATFAPLPEPARRLCLAWFPGGGTASLPVPYAHRLDRY